MQKSVKIFFILEKSVIVSHSPDSEGFLSCQKCFKTFHPKCCSPPLSKKIVERFPWYCNDCKLCFVCKSQGDENKMIICDICDRAFHSDCLTPRLNEVNSEVVENIMKFFRFQREIGIAQNVRSANRVRIL